MKNHNNVVIKMYKATHLNKMTMVLGEGFP